MTELSKEAKTVNDIVEIISRQGMKLLGGVIVAAAGGILIHWIMKLLARSKKYQGLEPTLRDFLKNLLKVVLIATLALTVAGIWGIPLTSFLALLTSAGVGISLAVQGALSNFVGGMTLYVLKPFKVGDYVQAADTEGTVQYIGAFYTELVTYDLKHVSMPNSNIITKAVTNYTREGQRRVDVKIGVSYSSDIDFVHETLLRTAKQDPRVFTDPEPMVRMTECGESSLNFIVRVWCSSDDYWEVLWALTENCKKALDKAGIEIPFPQVDVHMK